MCKRFKGKEYVFMTHNSIIDTKYFLLLFLLTIIILDILRPYSRSTFHPSQSPLHPDLYELHQCSSQLCSDNGRHKQLIRGGRREIGVFIAQALSQLDCRLAETEFLHQSFTALIDHSTAAATNPPPGSGKYFIFLLLQA